MLLLGFALPLWGKRVNEDQFPDKTEAIRVHAVGEQFFGTSIIRVRTAFLAGAAVEFVSGSNPLGIDPNDPAGQDDLVTKNDLHLVNHKPVVIEISSKERQVHSACRSSICGCCQDAIPGSVRIPMWFRPIRAGKYEIVCAQLCGARTTIE